jgi:hypothetical protein
MIEGIEEPRFRRVLFMVHRLLILRTRLRFISLCLPFVLAVLVIAIAVPPIAVGQKDSGGVAGVVRDSAGAVVPGAKLFMIDSYYGSTPPTQILPIAVRR